MYCSRCGEKRLEPRDRTLRHFFAEALEAFAHADSKLLRSLRDLVAHPGKLTLAFIDGRRKPYVGAVQLFLLVNVAFFVIQSSMGWNTFTTPLRIHETQMPHSALARSMVARRLASTAEPREQFTTRFNSAIALHAKTLVILMVPVFSLAVAALPARRRRYYVENLAFSFHVYTLFLVVLSGMNIFVTLLTRTNESASSIQRVDMITTSIIMVISGIYMAKAIGRIYGDAWGWVVVKAVVLTAVVAFNVQFYRFILFLVTMASTAT